MSSVILSDYMSDNKLPTPLGETERLYAYISKVNSIPSLEEKEEQELTSNYTKTGDISAAHRLVACHLKLVVKIAMKFRRYGLSMMDVIAEGNLGLMHAVKKFNPELGYRLSTYAMWWIKANIQDFILKSWSIVKLGTSAAHKRLFFSLKSIKNKIETVEGRAVNDTDIKSISQDMGISVRDINYVNNRISNGDCYLNDKTHDDCEGELIDTIACPDSNQEVMLESNQEQHMQIAYMNEAMENLTEREKAILVSRYIENKTLKELSNCHGVSMERIRQIVASAMKKVKSYIADKNGVSIPA